MHLVHRDVLEAWLIDRDLLIQATERGEKGRLVASGLLAPSVLPFIVEVDAVTEGLA